MKIVTVKKVCRKVPKKSQNPAQTSCKARVGNEFGCSPVATCGQPGILKKSGLVLLSGDSARAEQGKQHPQNGRCVVHSVNHDKWLQLSANRTVPMPVMLMSSRDAVPASSMGWREERELLTLRDKVREIKQLIRERDQQMRIVASLEARIKTLLGMAPEQARKAGKNLTKEEFLRAAGL